MRINLRLGKGKTAEKLKVRRLLIHGLYKNGIKGGLIKKILIIDNEKDLGFFVKLNLEAAGNYHVFIATEGKEGLRIARSKDPQLILLDILLPKMDGFEIIAELKQDEKTKFIPVIMMSALNNQESEMHSALLGHDDYITKPVSTQKLVLRIEQVLNRLKQQ